MLTVNRPGADPLVVEVPTGTWLGPVLDTCGLQPGAGVLVGGYRGAWLQPSDAIDAPLSAKRRQRHSPGSTARGIVSR
ncbi:hypothetical protein [Streptomyces puniciscabiei]|uniref:hypothetical protein n=1 Tax=Streptomyces puniciscabiei TaxID=164348 RepID=UPI003325C0F4